MSESESYCVPPYLAPCNADADCGAGFTCEAAEVCSCSSGGSMGAPGDGDEEPPPPMEDCSCEPSGENYCQLIEVICDSDADCADGLTCQEAYARDTPVTCSTEDPDNCADPEPEPKTSYCAPEEYGWYGGAEGGGSYDDAVAEATGRDDGSVTNSEREEFFPVKGSDGDGSKGEVSGCSTTNGTDASLLGLLFGALLWRRRR